MFQIGRPIGTSRRAVARAGPARHVDRGLGRAVQILQLDLRQKPGHLVAKLRRQRLAAADDALETRPRMLGRRLVVRVPRPLLQATCSMNACSIDGTKCSVVTPCSPIAADKPRRIAVRTAAQPPPAAPPTISGQKNSHTDDVEAERCLLQHHVVRRRAGIGVLHPEPDDCADPRGCCHAPFGVPVEPEV